MIAHRAALLGALVACDSGSKPVAPPAASPPPAQPRDATLEADAPNAIVIDAAIQPPDAAVETNPDDIQLTWVVFPPSVPDKRDPQYLLAPLTLEITTGGATQAKKLDPQFGALYPYNQIVCATSAYPLLEGEVAKITFYEGGAGGYFVRRTGNSLGVYSWSQTDGMCGTIEKPAECPRPTKLVAQIAVHAKAHAKLVEHIEEVDDKGVRAALKCAD